MGRKRKSGSGLSGEEKQARRRERLEARREAKVEAEARRRRAQQRERFVRLTIFSFLILGVLWFLFLRDPAPAEINGHEIEGFSAVGVGEHVAGTVSYDSTPPVSGQHAQQTLNCGTYAQEIPNETQVHMLEHGAVGVQYKPDLAPEQIQQIEEIVSSYSSHVFSAPYAAMEDPITLSSWSRLMRLDEVEEDSIRQYIEEFDKEGPEAGQPCDMEAEDSFDPSAGATPSPEVTPVPEESPTDDGGGGGNKKKKGSKG
jgi:hypothetical protein